MTNIEKKRLRIGILGGSITSAVGRAHVAAILLDGVFEISAGCFSRNPISNATSAAQYNVPEDHVYPNLEAMLEKEKENLDLILVLTPTNQHYSDISKCFLAGYSVISEKSVACSVEEVDALESIRNDKGLFAAVIFNYTGYSMLREARQRLLNHSIGKLLSVLIEMPQESFIKTDTTGLPVKPQEWRLVDYQIPTVSLDLGVHVTSILKFLNIGKPKRVVALQRNHGHFANLVDEVHGLFEWDENIIGNIWFGKASLGNRNGLRVRLFGAKGSLQWIQTTPDQLEYTNSLGEKRVLDAGSIGLLEANSSRYNRFKVGHPTGFIEALANHYQDIAETYRNFKTGNSFENHFVFSLQDARDGLEILEHLHLQGARSLGLSRD